MIEHDMDFISRMCDPVIVMSEGSVLFEGTSDEVKKNDKVIETSKVSSTPSKDRQVEIHSLEVSQNKEFEDDFEKLLFIRCLALYHSYVRKESQYYFSSGG